jgi:hypothetical protein
MAERRYQNYQESREQQSRSCPEDRIGFHHCYVGSAVTLFDAQVVIVLRALNTQFQVIRIVRTVVQQPAVLDRGFILFPAVRLAPAQINEAGSTAQRSAVRKGRNAITVRGSDLCS